MTRAFTQQFDVTYRDQDPAGHVSATLYYVYMLNAYMAYAHELLEIPLTEGIPQIMLKTSCEYVHPAKWGDRLEVSARVSRLGTKSFDIEYRITVAGEPSRLIATGGSTHVAYDYASERTVPLSEAFRERVRAYQESAREAEPVA
ncbi:acyl-CoA thioesterase [Burkholderia gladioli]|uniref:acyl-CoA thioesterase n=1 Tax=Burkholderia gladioli TaxID=28095 RepID=UPI0003A76820|nr:thioesterase family protein [Burkholderia gladioli]NHH83550.1 1,4-dihydroxy-2-naphthoyl-CoA hydrolase [Burkholderia gladioli]